MVEVRSQFFGGRKGITLQSVDRSELASIGPADSEYDSAAGELAASSASTELALSWNATPADL